MYISRIKTFSYRIIVQMEYAEVHIISIIKPIKFNF